MKESRLKVVVKELLKGIGFRAKKFFPYGNAGEPDIEAYRAPVLWGIEMKRGESPSAIMNPKTGWKPIQRVKALEILNAGGAYCLLATGTRRVFAWYFDPSNFRKEGGEPFGLDDLKSFVCVQYSDVNDWFIDFQIRDKVYAEKIKKGVI